MEKSKKISFTSIAIVVLAILLTVSLTMGGTLAWFANQNQAETTLTMGNAVGVAVVDNEGNGSMDRLSFTFHTGANGELMLPGTQVDPDVRALVAKSNTNTILRAVVTFEVSLSKAILADSTALTELKKVTGEPTTYVVDEATGATKQFVTVPSSIVGNNTGTLDQQELYVLNQMYVSFFDSLQASAVYNGWVYRESNIGVKFTTDGKLDTGNTKVFKGSAQPASPKYYIAGATQYADTPLGITRLAGPGKTQAGNGSFKAADSQVMYNAFYFRGWQGTKTYTAPADTYDETSGDGIKYVNKGIDGTYAETYSAGSLTSSIYHGGGRAYFETRSKAAAGTTITDSTEYKILEGEYTTESGFVKTADPLGYRKGDANDGTPDGSGADNQLGRLNVSTTGSTAAFDSTYAKDGWRTSGVQAANEDMMCVLNTSTGAQRIPLFTTSFILPTTWTQDAFADRSIRLNVTFQVMQSDYLASGSSHHVSVELAESRFDDVTIWTTVAGKNGKTNYVANQPYVKDITGQPNFDNPYFWAGDYPYDPSQTPSD